MKEIPHFSNGTINLFVAGYTGVEFSSIESVEVIDDMLCVNVGTYYNEEIQGMNREFFERRTKWDEISLFFLFPIDGWDYLGKGTSFYNDGKKLYEDTLERYADKGAEIF